MVNTAKQKFGQDNRNFQDDTNKNPDINEGVRDSAKYDDSDDEENEESEEVGEEDFEQKQIPMMK